LRGGVQHHFGHQALRVVAGVESGVILVFRERLAAALIGLALHDGAHERLEIELLLHEVRGRVTQQFFIAGRVRHAEVVHGLDQRHSEEVFPHAIRDAAGEPRVLRRGEPLRERNAAVFR
jgi:hypothetical protein